MKQYELTVLIHPDLEMNPVPAIDKIKKILADSGGTITKESSEGKKHLAYPINGQDFALYYYYEVDLPATAPQQINSVLNITDEVIRYLLVKTDSRKQKLETKKRANTTQQSAESTEEGSTNEEE